MKKIINDIKSTSFGIMNDTFRKYLLLIIVFPIISMLIYSKFFSNEFSLFTKLFGIITYSLIMVGTYFIFIYCFKEFNKIENKSYLIKSLQTQEIQTEETEEIKNKKILSLVSKEELTAFFATNNESNKLYEGEISELINAIFYFDKSETPNNDIIKNMNFIWKQHSIILYYFLEQLEKKNKIKGATGNKIMNLLSFFFEDTDGFSLGNFKYYISRVRKKRYEKKINEFINKQGNLIF